MSFDKLKMINEIYADRQETVKFSRMYDDVILPSKKDGDAGYDIYARLSEDILAIEPHQTVLIPTGLRVWIPDGHYMQLFERGSTGTKGIAQRAGVIDSSYTGEILIPITNVNPDRLILAKPDISIPPGLEDIWDNYQVYFINKAITQGVILPVPNFPVEEIPEEEMLARNTDRGQGRLGSSRK